MKVPGLPMVALPERGVAPPCEWHPICDGPQSQVVQLI
jgi:hypothetical protein